MAICYGPVVSKKISSKERNEEDEDLMEEYSLIMCCLCKELCAEEKGMKCLLKDCSMQAHTICLAKHFLGNETSHIVPIEGTCPKCETSLLWGDVVRKKKGCYSTLGQEDDGYSLSDYETEIAS